MAIRVPIPAVIPPSPRRLPGWTRIAAPLAVVGGVVFAFWIGGGKITNDFAASLVLTAVLVGAVGAAALGTALRWRSLAAPVLAAFVVSSGAIGGYLAFVTLNDRVVDERVATGPALVEGTFASLAHGTSGTARIVELADGSRALTLTAFETDAGPDLRVYVSPGTGGDVEGAVDLGALKGNVGNQQYVLPPDVDDAQLGSVVIWCRAFSVAFGAADLVPA